MCQVAAYNTSVFMYWLYSPKQYSLCIHVLPANTAPTQVCGVFLTFCKVLAYCS